MTHHVTQSHVTPVSRGRESRELKTADLLICLTIKFRMTFASPAQAIQYPLIFSTNKYPYNCPFPHHYQAVPQNFPYQLSSACIAASYPVLNPFINAPNRLPIRNPNHETIPHTTSPARHIPSRGPPDKFKYRSLISKKLRTRKTITVAIRPTNRDSVGGR